MNNYEILGTIGQGAYGIVLKARCKKTDNIVAIKKFKQSDDESLIRKTTVRQLKTLRNLQHKNIVQLQEAFKKSKLVHLVFQYFDNNLLEVLEQYQEGLSLKSIAKFIFQLLEGLDYMHTRGYTHRDIKPENLLVNTEGILKICDMGFATVISDAPVTDYVATRWYRPPELLLGGQYGPPIDIWAVGCILAELTDGQPLFPGSDEIDQLYQIIKGLGNLPDRLKQRMKNNPTWDNIILPKKDPKKSCILDKYKRKLTENGVNLLKQLLELEPSKRMTASQALNHSFFDIIRPKKPKFQKTSQGWLESSKNKGKTCLQQNFTDRNARFQDNGTHNWQQNYQNLDIAGGLKGTEKCGKNILKLTKNIPFIIQKKNTIGPKSGKENNHSQFQQQSLMTYGSAQIKSQKITGNTFLLQAGVNKIYRNSQVNRSKYIMGSYKIAQKKIQKFNTTLNALYNSGRGKLGGSQTKTQFRLGHRKKQRSNYMSYKA